MEKREFKVGDKVKIPKTKSKGGSLSSSHVVDKAKRENQDYLFVVRIDGYYGIKDDTYVLHWKDDGSNIGGDYYTKSDLEHYEEFPEKWAIELYPEVKKWIEEEHKTTYYSSNDKSFIFHFPNWENEDGFFIGGHTTFIVKEGYTLITLEEFKKHFLKEEQMERKITGYKLIKEYPGSKGLGYFEKYTTGELSKYPEFWEPIYEEEYKVGDWVTVTEVEGSGWLNYCSQKTFELKKSPTHYCGGIYWGVNEGGLHAKFRKATPEEIKAAKKQIIKMYSSNKGEFEIEVVDGKAYYRPENKELPKEWIKRIINSYNDVLTSYVSSYNPYEIKIVAIKVGCMEGTRKEDWVKVYKLLK